MTQLSVQTKDDLVLINLGRLVNKPGDDEFYEFCRANPELRIEQTKEGNMIIMLPTYTETGNKNFKLTVEFGAWVKTDGQGEGFDSSTGFILPNGAKRAPDVSWIRRERWDALPKKSRQNLRTSARILWSNCALAPTACEAFRKRWKIFRRLNRSRRRVGK